MYNILLKPSMVQIKDNIVMVNKHAERMQPKLLIVNRARKTYGRHL